MRVINVPLEIQEERARRAGVSLEVWQAQANQRVSNMRVRAYRRAGSISVLNLAELSESQKRALHRMSFSFSKA